MRVHLPTLTRTTPLLLPSVSRLSAGAIEAADGVDGGGTPSSARARGRRASTAPGCAPTRPRPRGAAAAAERPLALADGEALSLVALPGSSPPPLGHAGPHRARAAAELRCCSGRSGCPTAAPARVAEAASERAILLASVGAPAAAAAVSLSTLRLEHNCDNGGCLCANGVGAGLAHAVGAAAVAKASAKCTRAAADVSLDVRRAKLELPPAAGV